MRRAEIKRMTAETDIVLSLCLDGTGEFKGKTGCGFLDHMLALFSKHGHFDLDISCKGDTEVDYHHTVEDTAKCLGEAFAKALGDKRGIRRYGDAILPMDEALVLSSVDISGRGECYYVLDIPTEKVGDFDTELCGEFWRAFARSAGITLHIRGLSGLNSHHIIECAFKSVSKSLAEAVGEDVGYAGKVPSTKGEL